MYKDIKTKCNIKNFYCAYCYENGNKLIKALFKDSDLFFLREEVQYTVAHKCHGKTYFYFLAA